jgi:hypothetical protein
MPHSNPVDRKASQAAYRARNRDRLRLKDALRYRRNPEKERARNQAWRARNRDRYRALGRADHARRRRRKLVWDSVYAAHAHGKVWFRCRRNRDKIQFRRAACRVRKTLLRQAAARVRRAESYAHRRTCQRAYYDKNRERVLACVRAWRAQNPDYARVWYEQHRGSVRAYRNTPKGRLASALYRMRHPDTKRISRKRDRLAYSILRETVGAERCAAMLPPRQQRDRRDRLAYSILRETVGAERCAAMLSLKQGS